MPETLIVGLPMAFSLGLLFGMGPCLISCAPYLGPVFIATDGGVRQAWRILLPVFLGRLTAYGSFGALSGWIGQQVLEETPGAAIRLALGAATLMIGAALLLRSPGASCAPRMDTQPLRPLRNPRPLMPGGLYLMGLGIALNPCAPLGIVLVSAAATASMTGGLMLSLGFGLGALIVPALVYGLGAAYLSTRLRQQLGPWLSRIEKLSASMLILIGIRQLFLLH